MGSLGRRRNELAFRVLGLLWAAWLSSKAAKQSAKRVPLGPGSTEGWVVRRSSPTSCRGPGENWYKLLYIDDDLKRAQTSIICSASKNTSSAHAAQISKLLRDWGTHTEFSAKLGEPMGAVLGEYLSETHVKIIDPGRPVRRGPRPTWNLKFTTTVGSV